MVPSGFGKTVRRLFRDSRKVEVEYYRKTRIFPIMHTLVLKADLYKEKPWLALSFYRAFCRARDLAQASIYDTDAGGAREIAAIAATAAAGASRPAPMS
jgi:hypothetical protein